MKITTEEWQAELDRVYAEQDAPGMTMREIARVLGVIRRTARDRIQAAIEAGLWEYAGRATRPTMDGRQTKVPVYRPVPRTKKQK